MPDGPDIAFMTQALRLAENGRYSAHPNPVVGCVVVKDGELAGGGWHEVAGEAHAEINALKAAGDDAEGATVYVTLEPCSHHGKTPPCAEALIAAHKVTQEALQEVDFTDRYFFTPARFISRRDLQGVTATPTGLDGRTAEVIWLRR